MTKPFAPGISPAGGVVVLVVVAGLPLAGSLLLGGRSLAEFTQFPPATSVPSDYLRYSGLAAGAVVAVLLAIVIPWISAVSRSRPTTEEHRDVVASGRRFPLWGWLSLGWTLAWWWLAWTRGEWFASLQRYTFFPLWLGFIVTVNAAVERRTGSCLLRRAPGRWLALFGVSAVCWWSFEWLNRFVLNWHYLGVEDLSAWPYFFHATICFATVLPAIAAVAEWIDSHRAWDERVRAGPACTWLGRRDTAVVLLVLGGASLFATGLRPQWFYPALWVSPLALLLALPVLKGTGGLAVEIARGDWRRAATWMLAALICGFFWELWNWHSLAKWVYTVPGVQRWLVFEMPALGYVGYLPFGLECLLVAEWTIGARWKTAPRNNSKTAPPVVSASVRSWNP